jgi:nucleotide-binding universal stress UspA family protein
MEKLTHILAIADDTESSARVLEKSVVLARGFGAGLEFVCRDEQQFKQFASVCGERGYAEVVLSMPAPGAGRFEEAALQRVYESSPDLVVTALAPGALESRLRFSRACPAPVMLMGGRSWRTPVRIAAAVDASKDVGALARSIVHTAGFLTLGLDADLDVIYSERERQDEVLRMAHAVRLARLVREFHVPGDRVRRLECAPEKSLVPLAASGHYDIVILGGGTGRSGPSILHPSLTHKVVEACTTDVVLIREDLRACSPQRQVTVRSRAAR